MLVVLTRKANRNTSQAIQNLHQDLVAEARVLQRIRREVAVRVLCRCDMNMWKMGIIWWWGGRGS